MIKTRLSFSILAAASTALLSSTTMASDFNLGINNDTVEVGLYAPLSQSSRFSADYLYHDQDGDMLELGFQVTNRVARGNMALGLKAVKLWSDVRDNGHAFAIGGDYSLMVAPKTSIALSAYYAPSVLSYSGVDRFYHADAKVVYDLMPNADVYVGYRDVHFKFENARSQTLDQSLYLGATLKF